MKQTKVIAYGMFAFELIVNILVLLNIRFLYIRELLSFILITIMPGLSILLAIKIKNISTWEYIIYSIGLSISFIMFTGLALNWVLPWLHITGNPLSLIPFLISIDIFLLVLGIIFYKRNKETSINFNLPTVNLVNKVFLIIPLIFPILSILGVLILNKGDSNYLIMLLIFLVALYVLFTGIFQSKLQSFKYEIPIYVISLSLLLMFSMRSGHIAGWDIYQEYKVFNLTETKHLWSPNLANSAYNACLSITILPTLYHAFTNIDSEYVYKLLFQIIFSIVPVGLYLFLKEKANIYLSFLSSFFFISTYDYFGVLPTLIRQEIAYLFYILLLFIIFNKNLASLYKKLLVCIFGLSLIVSHYSTTFITIAIVIFTYISILIYSKLTKNLEILKNNSIILLLISILLIFTLVWYGLVTPVILDASNIFKDSISKLSHGINNTQQLKTFNTSLQDQFNLFGKNVDINNLLAKNIQEITTLYRKNGNLIPYPESIYGKYRSAITYSNILPLQTNKNFANIVYIIGRLITIVIKIAIFGSILYLTYISFNKKTFLFEYTVVCIGFGLIIFIMISLPLISLNYPTGRLYQQALFVLALPSIMFLNSLLSFIKKRYRVVIITILFVVNFMYTTSAIPQLIGNIDGQIYLNNKGKIYNEIIIHNSEISSINWLSKYYDKKYYIFSDRPSENKITTFSNIPWTFNNTFPSTLDINSYIYLSRANNLYGVGTIYLRYSSFEYNFPNEFIAENKNLVYNNNSSKVFK